ncbi:hypothetical protein ACFUMH_16460 [Cellulomonas sp. NPDC057328]|uniref:hypothetical protein n=1 Tax=Cellulomonas sp. NPDC057328 TaxID=3346101 RepID=UPI00363AD574
MKRHHLPLVLLTAGALLVAPAAAASATGDGDRGWHASTWHGKPGKGETGKPGKGPSKPGKPELCGGWKAGQVIPWDAYTCDKATGYFLYEKKDARRNAGWSNSTRQHRVALHPVWAWPTADDRQRHEASSSLPRSYEVVPLVLDATDTAAVCAEPGAYGLQVDLVGNGIAGRTLDLASAVPTVITPPDGGFHVKNTLAFYGHYDVAELLDLDALCAPAVPPVPVPTTPAPEPTTPAPAPTTPAPVPTTPAPEPTTPAPAPTTPAPVPTPEPTDDVAEEPAETPAPVPTPTADVSAAPQPTATPAPAAAAPTPSPSVTERAEVLAATDDAPRNRGQVLAATGTSALVGLLAAVGAVAIGAVLMILRRRGRTTEA